MVAEVNNTTKDRRQECFREGRDANHRNRRRGANDWATCPYPTGSEESKWWREGYNYQDMVNDG